MHTCYFRHLVSPALDRPPLVPHTFRLKTGLLFHIREWAGRASAEPGP